MKLNSLEKKIELLMISSEEKSAATTLFEYLSNIINDERVSKIIYKSCSQSQNRVNKIVCLNPLYKQKLLSCYLQCWSPKLLAMIIRVVKRINNKNRQQLTGKLRLLNLIFEMFFQSIYDNNPTHYSQMIKNKSIYFSFLLANKD